MAGAIVSKIDTVWVDLPFKVRAARYVTEHWAVNFQSVCQICRITLQNGVAGFGEGGVDTAAAARLFGRDPSEAMWDDAVGPGLQMALFDAAARTRDVPIHRLIGAKQRHSAALSWWAPAMPPRDWADECIEARSAGYTWFKAKARPWVDLDAACGALDAAGVRQLAVGFDFNSWLQSCRIAEPYLLGLERFSRISLWEEPIPGGDLSGNQLLRAKTRVPIVLHFDDPPVEFSLGEDICAGFVIGGGVKAVLEQARTCASAGKPFVLQMPGSGLRAAFCLQIAAVLPESPWPAVTLHHLFEKSLIEPTGELRDGKAAISDSPGLGFDVNLDTLERYGSQQPTMHCASPANRLFSIQWPNGSTSYYTSMRDAEAEFRTGCLPLFLPGVLAEEIPEDDSRERADLHRRAKRGGVHVGPVPITQAAACLSKP